MYHFYRKPTTHKGKKVLLSKEPQVIENTKQTFLLKGRKVGGFVTECLKDLVSNWGYPKVSNLEEPHIFI